MAKNGRKVAFSFVQLTIVLFNLCRNVELVRVRVAEGELEGIIRNSSIGQGKVYSFQGIPYAQPPIGELRFKAPRPIKSWKGVRNATQHGPVCTQFDIVTQQFLPGSEDCLFLNVYTNTLTPKKPLPVIFYIHGGGWKSFSGNEDQLGPDFLVANDVILVTFNYRVEVLGFLCLDNKEVPGNAGMKDQNLALKWVYKNIKNFGGNPNDITIMGQSAGAASVLYHMMSPMSKGWFKKGIAMSGNPFMEWAIPPNDCLSRSVQLGKSLGINTNDPNELLKYLQKVPVDQLVDRNPTVLSQEDLWVINPSKMLFFVPVVEGDFGQDRFLIESPKESLVNKHFQDKDLMMGYTSKENIFLIPNIESPDSPLKFNKYDSYIELMVPREILLNIHPNNIRPVGKMIRKYYFGDNVIDEKQMANFIRHSDDFGFVHTEKRFLSYLLDRSSKVYAYKNFLYSQRNIYAPYSEKYGIYGCAHTDDLRYIFDAKSDPQPVDVTTREYTLIKLMSKLVTNFVKYGNPTPDDSFGVKWLPYDSGAKNFMNINDTLVPGQYLDEDIYKWWQNVYDSNGVDVY